MRGKDDKVDPGYTGTAEGSKRVKPLGANIFGTPFMTAEGSKRVRPGDPNTTSAEFIPPSETMVQKREREARERREDFERRLQERESFISSARQKLLKRGWMNQQESEVLKGLQNKSNRT